MRFLRHSRLWAVLIFLAAFALLLNVVADHFLIPAMRASQQATAQEQRWLVAVSVLLLAVILVIIIAGLIMSFRAGRFFQPRPTRPLSQTPYVDAWAESARRIKQSDSPP